MPTRILGVIPARYESSRFPGKPLAQFAGKSMIEHVWERASQARYLTSLTIATDDERIAAEARRFRARVTMTRTDHLSGTDRAAEVASASDAHWVINIQGDEPLIDPGAIDALVLAMIEEPEIPMGTLCKRMAPGDPEAANPNVVKVVRDLRGNAVYFSRSPIPFVRDGGTARLFRHVGLYAYQRDFLLGYPDLPVGPLETAEKLEQLRAIENGYKIRVVETEYESIGVDTPQDLERVAKLFAMTWSE
ncbi:MAG: 3-deoxy-manno-octulosonate cytidylyltransferase [Bryobacteraceae bacterium]|nr:3-deoxy-manno-octulosonate cytidylyltransferase [Bryobacteraceae bacterium]